jgi:hypothetical protein
MKPKVRLRKALEDPRPAWLCTRRPYMACMASLLIAAMGEPLTNDELKTFRGSTGPNKSSGFDWLIKTTRAVN